MAPKSGKSAGAGPKERAPGIGGRSGCRGVHVRLRSAAGGFLCGSAPAAGGFLEAPWQQLVSQTRSLGDAAVQSEYRSLFEGVGKPEVYLFGSHYLSGFLNERPLAQLRTDLAALGLARDETMAETEDHVAYLCEVMRYLIAGDDVAVCNLARQKEFFAKHMQSWMPALCDTLAAHPQAVFYAALAHFTQAFVQVETQGFDMLE